MGWKEFVASLLGVSAYQSPQGFGPELGSESVEQVRKAIGGQLQPLPTTRLRWYLADLQTAQAAADEGNLQPAAQLYRAMRRDGVLAGLLGTRSAGLVRLPKRFYGDTEIVDTLRDNNGSRSVFDEMFPPAELAQLSADGVSLGIGVAELVPVEGRKYPVMVRLDPEFLQYRWAENRWYFLSIAGALPITPGDGRWILHLPGARMSPWHFGLWPALGRSFINKEHALLHRSNYSAKLANPARAAIAPAGATDPQRAGFLQRLIAWGVNTVFELPPGWDVKLLESNGRGIEVFQAEIDTTDKEYMVAISGQLVTTTGGTGFANADIHQAIRQDLIKGDGESLAYTINTQGLPQYIATNFPGRDLGAVNVEWDTSTPKQLKDEAQTLLTLSQGIAQMAVSLQGTGRTLNLDELSTRYGIPLSSNIERDEGTTDTPQAEIKPAAASPTPKPAPEESQEAAA